MKQIYRFQVPALICFDIEASSIEEALTAANTVRDAEGIGWNINFETETASFGRAYFDSDPCIPPLTSGDIVDICGTEPDACPEYGGELPPSNEHAEGVDCPRPDCNHKANLNNGGER